MTESEFTVIHMSRSELKAACWFVGGFVLSFAFTAGYLIGVAA